ncbi:L,D-transpeptidase family protein [Rhizobium metallidurans]|uniref:Murein L,D-transpeptidase YafK n=1 Tax=Rhizobium metallidurans TaxID=1265931 RepID=A0A7W6G9Z8_9HYPH|nr:murein L,D-transpeptidase family protein [Rhizobium metallidurans]MBB3963279.1 murein L,D-transpeptidase YafK [Rhizobium metallidurans]
MTERKPRSWKRFGALSATIVGLGLALSGCVQLALDDLGAASPEISQKTLVDIKKKGMTVQAPVLVRLFKEESELEVWKQDASGRYALLKTYPICRWSGKLGPKKNDGDRQAPEGFYSVTKGMLNPQSQYYLSFNLGYPNRLEAALGYTGTALMVHGACSSSGCYAMTDQGVGEIYALVKASLEAGQNAFQVQAFPFRMTAQNMASHREDPNFEFWRTMKAGYDSFEATRTQPKISTCGGKYVVNAEFEGGEPKNPLAACPARIDTLNPAIAAKFKVEDTQLSALVEKDGPLHANAYVDGGMHPSFRALLKQNGAEKLAARISTIKYPVSRPEAALADPYDGAK